MLRNERRIMKKKLTIRELFKKNEKISFTCPLQHLHPLNPRDKGFGWKYSVGDV